MTEGKGVAEGPTLQSMTVRNPLRRIAPLLLNGYALVLNAGVTAVLGMVFWFAATRLYSQEQVGVAAALISAMTTISYFAQMNLGSLLVRFLSVSVAGARGLIGRTYLVSGAVTALVAGVFALGIGAFTEPLDIIRESWSLLGYFVCATVLWTIFALQDSALSGLRRSTWVPVENISYALFKILLLLVVGWGGLSASLGIFVAWTAPLLPLILVVNLLILRWLPSGGAGAAERGPDLRTATRFLGWDFVGSLALGAAIGLAPLMIMSFAGAEATANYHLAWSFSYSVYLIGRAMSVSLVAEGASNPLRLRRLIADTLGHGLALVVVAALVLFVFAPQFMGLFGAAYVEEGASVLRVLALSCIPWTVTTVYCAVARVRNRTRVVAVIQMGTLGVFAAVSAALVGGHGATGVAFGWLAAHLSVCLGIILRVAVLDGWPVVVDWLLALLGSANRLVAALPKPAFMAKHAETPIPDEIIELIEGSALRGSELVQVKGSLTDVRVVMVKTPEAAGYRPNAVLKFAKTPQGIASLHRNAEALRSIAAFDGLKPYAPIVPALLFETTSGDFFCTAETVVQGTEGRRFAHRGKEAAPALATVTAAVAGMHRATATRETIGEDWMQVWVDGPVDTLAHALRGTDSPSLALLRAELRRVFLGREARLGLGHGDLWAGNLFFTADADGAATLSGIVDWDTCRADALAAVDACQLVLTHRMQESGEEYGPVVRALLDDIRWRPEEMAIFAAAGLDDLWDRADPALHKAIVVLTWLRHVSIVLSQTEKAQRNRFWLLVNVERVLATIARSEPQPPAGSAPVSEDGEAGVKPAARVRFPEPFVPTCIAAALILWIGSLGLMDPDAMTDLGMMSILPWHYWLAVGAVSLGFSVSLVQPFWGNWSRMAAIMVLILILHATPPLIYGTLRYSWAWKHIGIIDYIQRHGGVNPSISVLGAYHNWPGFFWIFAWVAELLRLGPIQIAEAARFFSILSNVVFVFLLRGIYRRFTTDERLVHAGLWIFVCGNWIGQDYFSPQAMAYALYLVVLSLCLGPLMPVEEIATWGLGRRLQRLRWRLVRIVPPDPPPSALYRLLAVLGVALALILTAASHQLTPLILVFSLSVLVVLTPLGIGFPAIAALVLLYWVLFQAAPFTAIYLPDEVAQMGETVSVVADRLVDTSAVDAEVAAVVWGGRGLTLGLLMLAGMGWVRRYRLGARDGVVCGLFLAPFLIVGATSYGGEAIFRVFFFALPFIAFLAAGLFFPEGGKGRGRMVVPAFFLLSMLLVIGFLLGNNGKDRQYRFSQDEVAAAQWLYGRGGPDTLLVEGARSYPSQFMNYENFTYLPISNENLAQRERILADPAGVLGRWFSDENWRDGYVVLMRSQTAYVEALGIMPDGALDRMALALMASPEFELVYANKDARIFRSSRFVSEAEPAKASAPQARSGGP